MGKDEKVLARVARPLNDKEKALGLTYVEYVKMPIVFFVNKSVTIKDLTAQQACDVYSGKIKNWKEIGGEDSKIHVIRREVGDSSLLVLQEMLPGFKDVVIIEQSKLMASDQDTVKACSTTDGCIAFGAYPNVISDETVRVLTLGGKDPMDKDYPCIGKLGFVFKEANKVGAVKDFLDFALSKEAADEIRKAGALPAAE